MAAAVYVGLRWIVTSTPAGGLPLLTATLGFVVSRIYESFTENRARLYERRREAYATMLRPWRGVIASMIAARRGEQPEITMTPELATQATDAGFEGILYASDEVLRRYVAFRNVGNVGPIEVLGRLGGLLICMRRDP